MGFFKKIKTGIKDSLEGSTERRKEAKLIDKEIQTQAKIEAIEERREQTIRLAREKEKLSAKAKLDTLKRRYEPQKKSSNFQVLGNSGGSFGVLDVVSGGRPSPQPKRKTTKRRKRTVPIKRGNRIVGYREVTTRTKRKRKPQRQGKPQRFDVLGF